MLCKAEFSLDGCCLVGIKFWFAEWQLPWRSKISCQSWHYKSTVINSVPNHSLITQIVSKHSHQLVGKYHESNLWISSKFKMGLYIIASIITTSLTHTVSLKEEHGKPLSELRRVTLVTLPTELKSHLNFQFGQSKIM